LIKFIKRLLMLGVSGKRIIGTNKNTPGR